MVASHHSVIPIIRAAILLASATGAGEARGRGCPSGWSIRQVSEDADENNMASQEKTRLEVEIACENSLLSLLLVRGDGSTEIASFWFPLWLVGRSLQIYPDCFKSNSQFSRTHINLIQIGVYLDYFLDCLSASTEMPADYYSFMQDNNSSEPVKPTIPAREEKHWDL